MVEPKQTSESFPANNRSIARLRVGRMEREQKPVVLPLMRPLMLMVGNIFRDCMSKRRLAKEDHPIQAFLFDGPHKPLRKGIEIRTPGRQRSWLDSGRSKNHVKSNRGG
jgi:hypothetical protein